MDHITALQIKALKNVLKPDTQAVLRSIFRWYSSTYATPLHMVDDLPLDDILTHWFEYHFEQLDEEDVRQKAEELILTPEERAERLVKQENEDEEFYQRIAEKAAKKHASIEKNREKLSKSNKEFDSALKSFKEKVADVLEKAPAKEEILFEQLDANLEDIDLDGFAPPKRK